MFIVAILAILAAAIAAGTGAFTGGTTTESDKTKGGAIIMQAELLQEGVQKLITENNCADNQISFSNPVITGINGSDVYANSYSPADLSCNLFQPKGGGLTFPTVTASTQETADGAHFVFEDSNAFYGLGNGGNGTPALAGFLPIDSQTLCQQINSILGLGQYQAGDWYYIPTDSYHGHFVGSYNFANSIEDDYGTWPQGQMMGCLEEAIGGQALNRSGSYVYPAQANYFFFVVLRVR